MAEPNKKSGASKKRIVILGASGFIGNTLYKELCNYFVTFGSYFTAGKAYENNKQFFHYNLETDDIFDELKAIKPDVIISALRGNFTMQVIAHQHITEYVAHANCKLLFISSANVFDSYSKYPSYEYDKTLSNSVYGLLKIKIENMLMRLPAKKWAILRVPMVFGNSSPRVKDFKNLIWVNEPIEVFPNLILNVTYADKLAQQIHYIINQNKTGIFHLGSSDLVHHEDFVTDLIDHIGNLNPIYKRVYTTNQERYLAVLPRDHKLPNYLQTTTDAVIEHHLDI